MARTGTTTIKSTCPRDCYDACGMLIRVTDGNVLNVLGDRSHHVARGKLCGKCAIAYNGVFQDGAKRLITPLRRKGAKGTGDFEPVGWDVALPDIATRLKRIVDPRTIYHTHYTGTVSMIAGNFPCRFFNRLDATEVDPDTVCNKAGHVALADMFGGKSAGQPAAAVCPKPGRGGGFSERSAQGGPPAAEMLGPPRKLGVKHDCPILVVGIPSCRTEGFFRFCHASRSYHGRRS